MLDDTQKRLYSVTPTQMAAYLRWKGFRSFSSKRESILIFRRDGDILQDFVFPMKNDFKDYPMRLTEIVDFFSREENISKEKIVDQIFILNFDLIKLRKEQDGYIVKLLKIFQPANEDIIRQEMMNLYPELELGLAEVKTRLETLRKKRQVLRNNDGGYSLTSEGLTLVPGARSRESLDIIRALALGRRKW